MKLYKTLLFGLSVLVSFALAISSCQKLDRPAFRELIPDPPPPPLTIMDSKSYWHFNDNTRDTGEFRLQTTASNVSLVPGVTEGQAAQIGPGGYLVVRNIPDALKSPGSLTVAFWMKGVGPVQGGAQGLFAISNSKEFWGNFEMFLENLNNGSEAELRIFTRHKNVAGDVLTIIKIPGALDKWTHIAVTYNGATSELTIFADGQPTAINKKVLAGYGALAWNDVTGLVIGSFAFQTAPSLTNHGPEGWARSFNGALDQFRIFTKALTPAEVTNLFTNKL